MPVAALAPARPWRRALRRWIGAGAVAVTSLAVAGCGDTTGVSRQLVGQYSTQVFELDYGTFTEDVLAEGGYIDIDLRSNGSTTGTLFVPSTSAGEGDFLADLNGAWSRSGNVVRFSHSDDTFLNDVDFFVDGDALVADEIIGNVRVRVVLTRF